MKKNEIKAVVFDVGGVLHVSAHLDIIGDISETFKIPLEKANKIYNLFIDQLVTGKISEKVFWQRFITKIKYKGNLPELSLFIRTYQKNFKINDDVLEIVKKLKRQGYTLGILSNTITAHAEYNRKRKIYRYFDHLVFSHEVGLSKPDRRIYKYMLDLLKIKPEEMVFIDDIKENVVSANKFGIKAILFKDAGRLSIELAKKGVII